jgi:hypothetical protein
MATPSSPPPVALQQARERTIRELCDHFAADHIGDSELEGRLDRANRAARLEELRDLVADLPVLHGGGFAAAAQPGVTLARPDSVRDQQTILCVMSGARRRGQWSPPRQLNVLCVMGGAELDFREAVMPPGVTEVAILALMGGVEITVPPGLRVEVNGFAFMGGFEDSQSGPPPADPNAPVLRIGGFAMMGGVEVRTMLPGESRGDARRRARSERHELRSELKREMRRIRRGH